MDNDELMEVWEANLAEASSGSNKFKGMYFQGYLTSFEKTSPADDFVELSLTFGLNGAGKRGRCNRDCRAAGSGGVCVCRYSEKLERKS